MIDKIINELEQLRDCPQMLEYRQLHEQFRNELLEHRIHLDLDYGEMHPLFTFHGVPCFPRQDLVAVTGKAKCGKTFFTSILMASALWGGNVLGFEATQGLLKVLYVDTEQAPYSTQRVLRRVVKMSTLPYQEDRFQVLNLRGKDAPRRLELLTAALADMHPDLVIVDGIRDLLLDFNDIQQSASLIGRLMALAMDFDCCLVSILHQNKPKDDNNMRGHLGSELENKSAEVYELGHEERIFRVRQRLSRNSPLESDLLYELSTDAEGNAVPTPAEEPSETYSDAPVVDDRQVVRDAFGGEEQPLSFRQAIGRIWRLCRPMNLNGYNLWREARYKGWVTQVDNDLWRLAPDPSTGES